MVSDVYRKEVDLMIKNQELTLVEVGLDMYEELISLWRESHLSFHEGFRDTREEIKRQIESGCVKIFGVKNGDKLIGSVLCSDDARRGWINHIAVIPEFRKQGVAVKLIEASEKHFAQKGLKIIAALVEDHNESSWRLFEKTGYTQDFPGLRYYTKREDRNV